MKQKTDEPFFFGRPKKNVSGFCVPTMPGSAGPKIFLGWAGWPAGSMAKGKMVVSQGMFGRRRRPTRKKNGKTARRRRAPRAKRIKKARRRRAPRGKVLNGPEGPVFPTKTTFFGPKGTFSTAKLYFDGFYRFSLVFLMFS